MEILSGDFAHAKFVHNQAWALRSYSEKILERQWAQCPPYNHSCSDGRNTGRVLIGVAAGCSEGTLISCVRGLR